jgi:PAS domain S-box-containing protein
VRAEHVTRSRLGAGPFALLVVDAGGAIRLAEGPGLGALGLQEGKAQGRSIFEIAPDRPSVAEGMRRALAGEGSAVVSLLDESTFELRFEPSYGSDHHVTGGVLLALQAGRARDRAEQARRKRSAELRLLFDQVPVAIWATDRELRVVHAAGRLPREAGIDERHLVGTTLYDVVRSRDPTEPAIADHLAALNGESRSFDYQLAGRRFEVHVEPLLDESGRVAGCVGMAIDVTARYETEERLARSEARLAEAQRAAHMGSWEWEVERDAVVWSNELYRIYGIAPEEFEGTYESFLKHVHPDDAENTQRILFRALRAPQPFVFDHRIVRPDGSVRMLHNRGDVLGGQPGAPRRMIGSCWDVTDRWRAEQELERSVSLLRATLESTADGILVVDRQGRIARHNQRFLDMWRIGEQLASRGSDSALLSAAADQLEDAEGFLRRVRELYDQPQASSFDALSFRDGRVFERYSQPQRLGSEVVGRVWSFRDVTERERLLRRAVFLADASRLLASLDVEQALEGVSQVALQGLCDACAIDLFSGEGGPRRLLSITREPGLPISAELPKSIFAGHALIQAVGARSQMVVPLMSHGTVLGALIFAVFGRRGYTRADLELAEELARRASLTIENARLYGQATEALQARDEFLSVAAHELRGPVTSLHLAVQGMVKGEVPPAAVPRALEIVAREDRRLTRFVEELLDVAQIRTGRMHLVLERVDLVEVTREVVARLAPDLRNAGSSLSLASDSAAIGYWDRSRLDQLVTNLVSNAIKFGLGKPIEVEVSAREGVARLVVGDHGIGIPHDRLNRLFEPFERAVSSRHYGGLGLGLYIVRTIVDGLEGSIRVESEPGAGATFTVELPQERRS